MTPKEKAEEIIKKFNFKDESIEFSKYLANICVDEIISVIKEDFGKAGMDSMIHWYGRVKNEIDKL